MNSERNRGRNHGTNSWKNFRRNFKWISLEFNLRETTENRPYTFLKEGRKEFLWKTWEEFLEVYPATITGTFLKAF